MIIEPTMLDALTFEPHGVQIIEASAGTGKTFSITLLLESGSTRYAL